MIKKDYYKILEVEPSASAEDVKRAYRKLALRFHPDKNPNNASSEARFKELGEAYEILKDPIKRGLFDQWRKAPPPRRETPKTNRPTSKNATQASQSAPDEDTFEGFIHDIFGDFFGQPSKQGQTSASEKGSDLRYHLNITVEEAATGCDRSIQFIRQRGAKEETVKIMVKVPPGVEPGQRLKISGEGDSFSESGRPGDLYVVVDIKKHQLFQIEGHDVLLQLPLTFSQAAFGCSETIPTPTGFVAIDIPPGTPSGRTFRLKGKGYPKIKGRAPGDLLVKVVIDAPRDLTKEQKELLSRFESSKIKYTLREEYEKAISELRRAKP